MNPQTAFPLLYQSQLLAPYSDRLIHGFTGKPTSLGGPDTPDNPRAQVLKNRQALLETLQLGNGSWIIPEQVHGHRIGRTGDSRFLQTDGVLLTLPYHPVMLLFADCVPILLYDPVQHGGAVLHAGWRGTQQGMAQEGVKTMQNALGSDPAQMIAVLGPAIGMCCFQVSLAVAQALADYLKMDLAALAAHGFLAWDPDFPENPRVDLRAINRYQVAQLGVMQIEMLPNCTRCETAALFSHRRGEQGRNSAWMMLK